MKRYLISLLLALCFLAGKAQYIEQAGGSMDSTTLTSRVGKPNVVVSVRNSSLAGLWYWNAASTDAVSTTVVKVTGQNTGRWLKVAIVNLSGYVSNTDGTYVKSITLNTPNVLYGTPLNFTVANNAASGTLSLNNQSAYKLFGTGAVSGQPLFISSLDSNYIPTLHSESYYRGIFPSISVLANKVDKSTTINGKALSSNISLGITDIAGLLDSLHKPVYDMALNGDSITISIYNWDGSIRRQFVIDAVNNNGINALVGDGTATGNGTSPTTFTLANVNNTPGSFGSTSSALSATVNAKGLITSLSSAPIQLTESQVTNLTTRLDSKEPTLVTGTTSQYFRGDKSLATFPTIPVVSGTGNQLAKFTGTGASTTVGNSVLQDDGTNLALSGGSAFYVYNNTDPTNYERLAIKIASNNIYIGAEAAGTGVLRDMYFGRTQGEGLILRPANSTQGRGNFNYNNVSSGSVFTTTGTITGNAIVNVLGLLSTINQTSGGGYNGYYAGIYEQSTGGITNYFANWGNVSAANNGGTFTSKFNVTTTGIVNLTGTLNTRASTATAGTSPIKFAAGTLMPTPENGAAEYTSDGIFLTDGYGLRGGITREFYRQVADNQIANTAVRYSVTGSSASNTGTKTIPANFWTVGKSIHGKLAGSYQTPGVPDPVTVDIAIGTTKLTVMTIAASILATSSTARTLQGDWDITCKGITSGVAKLVCSAKLFFETTTGTTPISFNTSQSVANGTVTASSGTTGAASTVDWTVANAGIMDVYATWGNAQTTQGTTIRQGSYEVSYNK